MTEAVLYGYFRSSASYRVRIGLNLKGIRYQQQSINLLKREQKDAVFVAKNPQGKVPTLEIDGMALSQSVAILDYLEERGGNPSAYSFYPLDPKDRAFVRQAVNLIACDTHPLNNTAVLAYLKREFGQDQAAVDDWYRHWISEGFAALEAMVSANPKGRFIAGDRPGMAEILLVPQMFNARRFGTDLTPFPTLQAIDAAALEHPAFDQARPERQPDCPTELRE